MPRIGKSLEMASRLVVALGGEQEHGVTQNGHKGSFYGNGNVLKLDCGSGCMTL